MNVVVIGGHCRNKGAQLMLQVVAVEVGRILPEARLFVTPLAGTPRQLHRMGYRLLGVPLPHVGSRLFPDMLIRCMVRASPVLRKGALVLDISGFAYSDQFGVRPLRNLNILLDALKGTGVRFAMLPQSMGPFDTPDSAELFRRMAKCCALLCTRDTHSFSYVRKVFQEEEKVRLYPDITLGFSSSQKTNPDAISDYCCLVPNERMVDPEQGGEVWKERYVDMLSASAEYLHGRLGKKVYAVAHDSGPEDRRIVDEVVKRAAVPVEGVQMTDPLELKRFFSGSCLVAGSRFHALASALSSGVPSVAWGWSHKYGELFREYGQQDCVFESPEQFDVSLFGRLLQQEEYARRCDVIARATEEKKKLLEHLWEEIREIAQGKHQAGFSVL